jgi:hypothetical protein
MKFAPGSRIRAVQQVCPAKPHAVQNASSGIGVSTQDRFESQPQQSCPSWPQGWQEFDSGGLGPSHVAFCVEVD